MAWCRSATTKAYGATLLSAFAKALAAMLPDGRLVITDAGREAIDEVWLENWD
jgi:hypothetical protein